MPTKKRRVSLDRLKQTVTLAAHQACVEGGWSNHSIDVSIEGPTPPIKIEVLVMPVEPDHFAVAHGRVWQDN